jgi:hypothetical protein
MSGVSRIVGNPRDNPAAHPRIQINSGANSIRREVACETKACLDNRICDCIG